MRKSLQLLVVLTFLSSQLFASSSVQPVLGVETERPSSPPPAKVAICQPYDYQQCDVVSQPVKCEQSPFVENPGSYGRLSECSDDSSQDFMMLSLLCAESEKTGTKQSNMQSQISGVTLPYYITLAKENLATITELYNRLSKRDIFFAIIALLRRSPFFYSPPFCFLYDTPEKSNLPLLAPEAILFQLPINIQIHLYFWCAKALNGIGEFKSTVDLLTKSLLLVSNSNKFKEFYNDFLQKRKLTFEQEKEKDKLQNVIWSINFELRFAILSLKHNIKAS